MSYCRKGILDSNQIENGQRFSTATTDKLSRGGTENISIGDFFLARSAFERSFSSLTRSIDSLALFRQIARVI